MDDGSSIGKLRRVATHFSFPGNDMFFRHNIRVMADKEPLGCLGDVGWYQIRFILWAHGFHLPDRIRATLHSSSPQGVPLEMSGEMLFPGGSSASLFASFQAAVTQVSDAKACQRGHKKLLEGADLVSWLSVQKVTLTGDNDSISLRDFNLPITGQPLSFVVEHQTIRGDGCDLIVEQKEDKITLEEISHTINMIRAFSRLVVSGFDSDPSVQWAEMSLMTQMVVDALLCSAKEDGRWVDLGKDGHFK